MQFREVDGRYEAELRCGDVITFESEGEMREVEREWREALALCGRSVPELSEESVDACVCGKKKKVRIKIHTDEYLLGKNNRLIKKKAFA